MARLLKSNGRSGCLNSNDSEYIALNWNLKDLSVAASKIVTILKQKLNIFTFYLGRTFV